jgi:hypothetical protein
MGRGVCFGMVTLLLAALVGCSKSSPSAPAASTGSAAAGAISDPAAQVANDYLDAVIKGDTDRAIGLYTPVAAERMKQFPLPGIAGYSFHITKVAHPSDDRALVECRATSTSPSGETTDEDACLLLERVNDQWRVSGMAFSPEPNKPPMIFSFENPQRGAIPVQQWLAEARRPNTQATSAAPAAPGKTSASPDLY